MAIYSIKDLELLSGIRAHTIRIWEQRYGLIAPSRTRTNIRFYEDSELKHLLNVALLNRNGCKISKIATYTREEITAKVAEFSVVNFETVTQMDALTISMIEMDEQKFDAIINTNIKQIGFERTIAEVINPFLERLTFLWFTASIKPAQDNFMSCRIRQKLACAIDAVPPPSADALKVLLFLPEGDNAELPLLFTHYVIRKRGYKVVYLGSNNSLADVNEAYRITQPNFIFVFVSELFTKNLQQYVSALSHAFQQSKVLISGYNSCLATLQPADNVVLLPNQVAVSSYFDAVFIQNRVQTTLSNAIFTAESVEQ